jgi:hypothetical protein
VHQLHTGNEPDGAITLVVGDEQVVPGVRQEQSRRLGVGFAVEEEACGEDGVLIPRPEGADLDVDGATLLPRPWEDGADGLGPRMASPR